MKDLQQQTEDALNSIFDAINKMGGEDEVENALRNVLGKQHRTLQQNFMRNIIIPAIYMYAEKKTSGFTDLRNEASCELAEKLVPLVKNAALPFI